MPVKFASDSKDAWKPFDIEIDRVRVARAGIPGAIVSAGEDIPFADSTFDVVLSHEVIEHVCDDRRSVSEMLRVTRTGGRVLLFCPNRWYPFETHGHYWRGDYHFGNTPFINYLPKRWRDKLAPHARAYTAAELRRLLDFDGANIAHCSRIYGGYDNIIARLARRLSSCGIRCIDWKARPWIPGRYPILSSFKSDS